jgi:transcriptional regulator with XRE-family HTH domain
MDNKQTFGQFVLLKRKENNLTQRDLAQRLYVTESAVSKWERGVSFPDISLVPELCKTLNVTEHELITSSEDLGQRQIERQAKSYMKLLRVYSTIFYLAYGAALLTCFIVNLATEHRLSWFFIVLTSIMLAFSLTSFPLLVEKHRASYTLAAFYASLNLLILTCAIYTGGDWFGVTFISLLFGFCVVFLPFVLRDIPLLGAWQQHKALICLSVDTVLCWLVIIAANVHARETIDWTVIIPSALIPMLLPWGIMGALRYLPIQRMLRWAAAVAYTGVHLYLLQSSLLVTIDRKRFAFQHTNLLNWSDAYLSGNILLLFFLTCIAVALVLTGLSFRGQGKR